MKQVLKNHVAFVIDVSGSMSYIIDDVRKVFQNQIEFLRKTSLMFEQETRVSVYVFNTNAKCLISDVDVARPMEIEKLLATGGTAMLDAITLSINDLQELPQKYGDHSFMIYVLSDGEENSSVKTNANLFKNFINRLSDNFTICALAPSSNAVKLLEGYGLHKGNIDKWDTTEKGIEEVGRKMEKSLGNFYTARTKGIRSFSSVFSDLNKVTEKDIKQVAKQVKNFEIVINKDVKAVYIKPLVESETNNTYVKGNAFYELVKRETVQESKSIAVQDKKTGKVYVGYDARVILGLPDRGEIKVDPIQSSKWNIYVQSTSVNRNIIPKQRVLIIK
jgi:uncharacterized protein YegL